MITVFLVDDHEIVRRGVADLINAEPDLEVVGEAATARQALGRIAATSPKVAVLDVRLPDGSGIELCRDIRSAHPEIHCLMLTAYDDDAIQTAALAGASGFVLKSIRGQGLVESIRKVAAGRNLIRHAESHTIVRTAATEQGIPIDLSLRERQVLNLIAEGLTNRQIGAELTLAEKTVKNYVSGLLAKLGVERRTQAAVYSSQHPAG